MKKEKLGLVLSGGAARGMAHPGVIKALHEHDMYPEVISGASAGAIAGCLYADGFEPEEILELFKGKGFFNFTRFIMSRSGLLDITGLRKLLKNNLRAKKFEGLKKKLFVSVTNYRTGEPEYLDRGDLVESVIASSSIPVIFQPVKLGKDYYLDGGVVDNFPIYPIEKMCRKIIGVAVNAVGEETEDPHLVTITTRSLYLAISANLKLKKDKVDVFIEPPELRNFSLVDVKSGPKMFEIGYREASRILDQ